ncbi:hypothetical protein FQZ97_850040 [compost metagenome]
MTAEVKLLIEEGEKPPHQQEKYNGHISAGEVGDQHLPAADKISQHISEPVDDDKVKQHGEEPFLGKRMEEESPWPPDQLHKAAAAEIIPGNSFCRKCGIRKQAYPEFDQGKSKENHQVDNDQLRSLVAVSFENVHYVSENFAHG